MQAAITMVPKLTITQRNIHARAVSTVKTYDRLDSEFIQILLDAEQADVPRAMGVKNLFSYAVEILGLSKAVASAFVTVTRKAKEVPALKAAIA